MKNLDFNYYNIIPIILIEVIIVAIFESLVFIFSINNYEKFGISGVTTYTIYEINDFVKVSSKFNENKLDVNYKFILNNPNNINSEKTYVSTQYTYFALVLSFTIIGLILFLILYRYIVVNIIKKNIEWLNVSIVVIGISILIIIMECIFIFVLQRNNFHTRNEIFDILFLYNILKNYALSQNPQPIFS